MKVTAGNSYYLLKALFCMVQNISELFIDHQSCDICAKVSSEYKKKLKMIKWFPWDQPQNGNDESIPVIVRSESQVKSDDFRLSIFPQLSCKRKQCTDV